MFIRRLAEANESGHFLLITTREGHASTEYQQHLAGLELAGRLRVEYSGSANDGTYKLVRSAMNKVVEGQLTHVLVPDADALLPALFLTAVRSLGRRLPGLSVIVMRTGCCPRGAYRSRIVTFVKRGLLNILPRVWKNTRAYFLTDAFEIVSKRPGYESLAPVPNPAPELLDGDREMTREALGIGRGTFLVGLVGMLNKYKCPDLVIGALDGLPMSARLLAVGPADSSTSKILDEAIARHGDRILRIDRYVKESELGSYIAACNAIVLTYKDDDPSATLITAVRSRVPVVAAGSPWLKKIVGELELGSVVHLSAAGVQTGLSEIMAEPGKFDVTIRAALGRLVPEKFEKTLLKPVAEPQF